MMTFDHDVLVMGAGPAGTALAGALVAQGLRVGTLDPAPDRPWPNRYGAWVDELDALGLTDVAQRTWDSAELVLPDGDVLPIPRGYVSIDGERLRSALQPATQGVVSYRGAATDLVHGVHGATVGVRGGASLTARVVVDATGHESRFVQRSGPLHARGRSPTASSTSTCRRHIPRTRCGSWTGAPMLGSLTQIHGRRFCTPCRWGSSAGSLKRPN